MIIGRPLFSKIRSSPQVGCPGPAGAMKWRWQWGWWWFWLKCSDFMISPSRQVLPFSSPDTWVAFFNPSKKKIGLCCNKRQFFWVSGPPVFVSNCHLSAHPPLSSFVIICLTPFTDTILWQTLPDMIIWGILAHYPPPSIFDGISWRKNLVAATLLRSLLFRNRSSSFAFDSTSCLLSNGTQSSSFGIHSFSWGHKIKISAIILFEDWYFDTLFTTCCAQYIIWRLINLTCMEFVWKLTRLWAVLGLLDATATADTFCSSSSPPPPPPQVSSNLTCPQKFTLKCWPCRSEELKSKNEQSCWTMREDEFKRKIFAGKICLGLTYSFLISSHFEALILTWYYIMSIVKVWGWDWAQIRKNIR